MIFFLRAGEWFPGKLLISGKTVKKVTGTPDILLDTRIVAKLLLSKTPKNYYNIPDMENRRYII